jgi:hypothetical protein
MMSELPVLYFVSHHLNKLLGLRCGSAVCNGIFSQRVGNNEFYIYIIYWNKDEMTLYKLLCILKCILI